MIRTTSTLLQRLNRHLKQSGSRYDVNQTNSYVYEILQQLDRSKSSWIFSSPALLYFFCRKSKIHLPISRNYTSWSSFAYFNHIPFSKPENSFIKHAKHKTNLTVEAQKSLLIMGPYINPMTNQKTSSKQPPTIIIYLLQITKA